MMLREVRYGIQFTLTGLTISPFGPKSFSYHVGQVNIDYSPARVVLEVPSRDGSRDYTLAGLEGDTTYAVLSSGSCAGTSGKLKASREGVLSYRGPAGTGCLVTFTALRR